MKLWPMPKKATLPLVAVAMLAALSLFLALSSADISVRARYKMFHRRAAVQPGYAISMYTDPADLTVNEVSTLQWGWKRLGSYDHYEKENQALRDEPHRVVLMGDSISFYWSERSDLMNGKPYINRGVGGNTSADVLLRFQPDVIDLHPEMVVIGMGTNDLIGLISVRSPEWIENNIRSAVDIATANQIGVVLANIPPLKNTSPELDGKRSAINAWLAKYSFKRGIPYADYSSVLSDEHGHAKEELFSDGIHPNAKGYLLMKPLLEKALAEARNSIQGR